MRERSVSTTINPRLWPGLSGLAAMAVVSVMVLAPMSPTLRPPRDTTPAALARSWDDRLRVVDAALERRDVSAAVRAWHDAYGAALASRRWEPLLASGEAFVRIGEASGAREGAKPNARLAYMAALVLAERQRSVEGVRRAGDAFLALGDREVATYCARIADALAAR